MRSIRLGIAVAALAVSSCTVVRVYVGSQFQSDPDTIVQGRSTVNDILKRFGAPDRIQRQAKGDVFIYRYLRRDERTFNLEEPVITNTNIFTYTEIREDSDRLVVVFDEEGVVSAFGVRTGATEIDAGG